MAGQTNPTPNPTDYERGLLTGQLDAFTMAADLLDEDPHRAAATIRALLANARTRAAERGVEV
ncbi:MAG TPA: hypothetical protein VIQ30_01035 [Pseudonocardia sp.]